jgi:hypothetical protein
MLFPKYAQMLSQGGSSLVCDEATVLKRDARFVTFYTPFEHVVTTARLVLVGITPGTTQLKNAYIAAQSSLRAGAPYEEALRATKEAGAFSGDLRTNLIRMLKHFRFGERLGLADESQLWGSGAKHLHSTSVVPHAAFEHKNGKLKMFNGSFDEILKSPVLSECFRGSFIPSLARLPRDACYLALGPTPLKALHWCVREGLLTGTQVLGGFPHPSRSAGSQVDIFIRHRDPADLKPQDPVRFRIAWLSAAYDELQGNLVHALPLPG